MFYVVTIVGVFLSVLTRVAAVASVASPGIIGPRTC